MDVYAAKQAWREPSASHTTRPPLLPSEKNNAAATTRRPQTKEISSRYKSLTPSGTRRCPSPNITRTTSSNSQLTPKRAVSAERKRPSTPPYPTSPSTPVRDSSLDLPVSSRRLSPGRLPESLWPSTMRSLSVSFQSDTISIPAGKKEKPVNSPSFDRTLRPSLNLARRQGETPSASRKPTPERKRGPLKGKNALDQSENSNPVDTSRSRLIDQHRWPSRIGGKAISNSLNKSLDISDRSARGLSSSTVPGMGVSSFRRLSISDGLSKLLQKSSSDTTRLLSHVEKGGSRSVAKSVDDKLTWASGSHRVLSANSLDRTTLATAVARLHSLPAPGSRPVSPSRSSLSSSSSIARGVSPSRVRPSTPPSRGVSPSRIRQTSTSTQSSTATSVLTFIADVKKGKKGASYIEDAHQLRLLYNRFLQWQFANAHVEAVMYIQRITAEETLYNVWKATSNLLDLAVSKRISLEQLKLEIKLNLILNDQMTFLDDWAVLEQDHVGSVAGAVEDLQANTLRLPVTKGARADKELLKAAISSALDVMQAMGSSLCSLLSKVEEMNGLASQLAVVASQMKSMLDRCKDLLASTASMQIEECSLRTHVIQMKLEEASEDSEPPPIKKISMALTGSKNQQFTPLSFLARRSIWPLKPLQL